MRNLEMAMNFCDPCLLTQVNCNTVSTEGHEVENLVNGNNNGFLAYSAIRPPVHFDFTFICKIQISHILIWPSVGSQKSSGFRMSIKNATGSDYTEISTAFLKPSETGIYFHRRDLNISNSPPTNFHQRYVKIPKNTVNVNGTNNLRISIIKTENSVPALSKIEIWGKVSPSCKECTKNTIEKLWAKKNNTSFNFVPDDTNKEIVNVVDNTDGEKRIESNSMDVPEDFIDPITCEIMTKPIILPSGKIIDQTTLEKHEKTEASRGRRLTDPFTGIMLSETKKPVISFALKERIDKFLLEHSWAEEIKKMPRVLGSKNDRSRAGLSFVFSESQKTLKTNISTNTASLRKNHQIPCSFMQRSKRKVEKEIVSNVDKKTKTENLSKESTSSENELDLRIQKALADCKNFRTLEEVQSQQIVFNCNCCDIKILYKLPCEHIVCRKKLLASKSECNVCHMVFGTIGPVRIFL